MCTCKFELTHFLRLTMATEWWGFVHWIKPFTVYLLSKHSSPWLSLYIWRLKLFCHLFSFTCFYLIPHTPTRTHTRMQKHPYHPLHIPISNYIYSATTERDSVNALPCLFRPYTSFDCQHSDDFRRLATNF